MTKNLLYFTLIRIFPFCFNILETGKCTDILIYINVVFTFLRECRVFMDAAFSWFLSQGISRNRVICLLRIWTSPKNRIPSLSKKEK